MTFFHCPFRSVAFVVRPPHQTPMTANSASEHIFFGSAPLMSARALLREPTTVGHDIQRYNAAAKYTYNVEARIAKRNAASAPRTNSKRIKTLYPELRWQQRKTCPTSSFLFRNNHILRAPHLADIGGRFVRRIFTFGCVGTDGVTITKSRTNI